MTKHLAQNILSLNSVQPQVLTCNDGTDRMSRFFFVRVCQAAFSGEFEGPLDLRVGQCLPVPVQNAAGILELGPEAGEADGEPSWKDGPSLGRDFSVRTSLCRSMAWETVPAGSLGSKDEAKVLQILLRNAERSDSSERVSRTSSMIFEPCWSRS